jgi:hypothetical protein
VTVQRVEIATPDYTSVAFTHIQTRFCVRRGYSNIFRFENILTVVAVIVYLRRFSTCIDVVSIRAVVTSIYSDLKNILTVGVIVYLRRSSTCTDAVSIRAVVTLVYSDLKIY